MALMGEWELVAQRILARDFVEVPADKSTIQAYQIGLRGIPMANCQKALEKLDQVKLVAWGKRDIEAGRLLSRKNRGSDEQADNREVPKP